MADGDNGITSGKNNAAFTINNSGNAKATAFTALEDATLTIARIDNPHGKTFSYGYYVYENNSVPNSEKFVEVGNVTKDDTTITLSKSYDFQKDQMVGLWIKEGNTYYLTDASISQQTQLRTSTDNGHSEGYDAYAYSGKNKNDFGVKIYVNGTGTVTAASGVSGGPLPGVWATIALAGAAGTYLRRRKNK